jgi:hypothetical protein
MSATIGLTPYGQELLREQLTGGRYRTPEEVVERALEAFAQQHRSSTQAGGVRTSAEAVADIRELRKGVTLGNLNIKDLIHG